MGNFDNAIRLPSAKFPTVDTTVTGIVDEVTTSDVPHFTKEGRIEGVEVDDMGNTITQVDVIVATETGKIVLHTGGAIFYAIGRALAEVGADDLEPGDTLTVTYTGDGPKKAGQNAPKQYSATIVKS